MISDQSLQLSLVLDAIYIKSLPVSAVSSARCLLDIEYAVNQLSWRYFCSNKLGESDNLVLVLIESKKPHFSTGKTLTTILSRSS